MENQAAPIEYDAPVEDSRIIDTDIDGVKSGGGKPALEAPAEKPETQRKPESARDSLEAEAKKLASSGKEDDDQDDDDGDKMRPKTR